MGKQSARLYYQGNDHKDINFRGCLHDKMYVGGNLVWEKLYPDLYFIDTRVVYASEHTNDMRYIVIFLSRYGVEEREQCIAEGNGIMPFGYATYFLINSEYNHRNRKYVNGYSVRKNNENGYLSGSFYTSDFKKFIIPASAHIGIGENGFYSSSDNIIYRINDDLTITEIKCDEVPQIENMGFPFNHWVENENQALGNYVYYFKDNYGSEQNGIFKASTDFYVIDENGKGTLHHQEYEIPYGDRHNVIRSEEATKYAIDRLFGYAARIIVIQNSAYILRTKTAVTFGTGAATFNIYMPKRNLVTWETEEIKFYDDEEYSIGIGQNVYASVSKAIFLSDAYYNQDSTFKSAIVIKIDSKNASYKEIDNFSINIYGENRKMTVKSTYDDGSIINKDEIKINLIAVNYYLGATMSKGIYVPDAIDGIAFKFSYGNQGYWYISGYMYIDNQDFTESDNNYIYLLEEYEDGELIFSR